MTQLRRLGLVTAPLIMLYVALLTVTNPFVLRNGSGLDATLRMPTSSFLKLRIEADLPEPLSPKIKTAMPISHHSFQLKFNNIRYYILVLPYRICYIYMCNHCQWWCSSSYLYAIRVCLHSHIRHWHYSPPRQSYNHRRIYFATSWTDLSFFHLSLSLFAS